MSRPNQSFKKKKQLSLMTQTKLKRWQKDLIKHATVGSTTGKKPIPLHTMKKRST